MKIALWQTHPIHDLAEALAALDHAASEATHLGADVLITPELMLGGYNVGPARIAELGNRCEQIVTEVSGVARRHGIAIVCGLAEAGQGRPYNTALAIGADGRELMRYRKTHLFGDVDAAQFDKGPALPEVFSLGEWRAGLAICYDIEFPELTRHLAAQGADVILTPTANMQTFSSISARVVPSRAEENGLFIAYANYIGEEPPFAYGGCSCVCGPDGEDLARATSTESTLLIARLERDLITQVRASIHYLQDRRDDLYTTTQEPPA